MKPIKEDALAVNHTGSAVAGTNGLADPSMPKSPFLFRVNNRNRKLVSKIIHKHSRKGMKDVNTRR